MARGVAWGAHYSRVDVPPPARPATPASLPDMVATPPRLAQVLEEVDQWYPPHWAAPWDQVGLVLGSPEQPVRRVLLAVDPLPQVAEEARVIGADLVIAHHPLLLAGVHALTDDVPGARAARILITAGISLLTVHTNADVAPGGVNDALAAALGLVEVDVLQPHSTLGPGVGLGRVGRLPGPLLPAALGRWVADRLAPSPAGVRVAVPPDADGAPLTRVAVLAGAGESLLATIERGRVDGVITADCRHHRVLDAVLTRGVTVVDVSHAASEAPWLAVLARQLTQAAHRRDWQLEAVVSTVRTDPWTTHAAAIDWQQP